MTAAALHARRPAAAWPALRPRLAPGRDRDSARRRRAGASRRSPTSCASRSSATPELWPHLAAYVLPSAALNTLLLLGGRRGAHRDHRRRHRLARHRLSLSRPRRARLAAAAAARVPDLHRRLRLCRHLRRASGRCRPRCARCSAGSRPPTTGSRTSARCRGAIFVFGFVLYPYVYLAARAMFQTQSAALFEVARTLGATRFMLARHVALPLARPALAVGLSLALLETLNDIGASEYLGVRTLTLSIFTTWLNRSSLPGAAQIACVMLIAIAALIALERYGRRRQAFTGIDRRAAARGAIALTGWARWLAARGLPRCRSLLGFLLPAGLSRPSRRRCAACSSASIRARAPHAQHRAARRRRDRDRARARLRRRDRGCGCCAAASRRPASDVAGLGYAVPGTVLALGAAVAAGRDRRGDQRGVARAGRRRASASWSPARAPRS